MKTLFLILASLTACGSSEPQPSMESSDAAVSACVVPDTAVIGYEACDKTKDGLACAVGCGIADFDGGAGVLLPPNYGGPACFIQGATKILCVGSCTECQ